MDFRELVVMTDGLWNVIIPQGNIKFNGKGKHF